MQISGTPPLISDNCDYAQKGLNQLKKYIKIPIHICRASVGAIVVFPTFIILSTLSICYLKFNSHAVKPFAQRAFSIIKGSLIASLVSISYNLFSIVYKIFIIIGLFFGILFPKIGKQINAIDEKITQMVERLLSLEDLKENLKKMKQILNQ